MHTMPPSLNAKVPGRGDVWWPGAAACGATWQEKLFLEESPDCSQSLRRVPQVQVTRDWETMKVPHWLLRRKSLEGAQSAGRLLRWPWVPGYHRQTGGFFQSFLPPAPALVLLSLVSHPEIQGKML